MTAIEGFRIIARSALRHFSGNADAVRNLDPEGVHQMRVGLRRLRAAISLFSKALATAKTEEIKTELRWLTNELAPARELHVFLEEKIGPVAREITPRRGGKAIAKQFAEKRAEALAEARRAVDSPRCRALLVDVLAWIEAQHGRTDVANSKLAEFAAELLDRRLRKAHKDAAKLQEMTAPERHKFRIRMKKLRYAAQFFESLFRSKRERKALARLSKHAKKIQDALGSLNDFIADRKMAAEAALHAPPQDRRARAFASGIIVGREDQQTRPLMKAAAKDCVRFAVFPDLADAFGTKAFELTPLTIPSSIPPRQRCRAKARWRAAAA